MQEERPVRGQTEALAGLASRYESQAEAQVAGMRGLQAALRALSQQGKNFDREADRLHERADRLRDKADEIRDEADELSDKAEELHGKKRASVTARLEVLLQKAYQIAEQAEALSSPSTNAATKRAG